MTEHPKRDDRIVGTTRTRRLSEPCEESKSTEDDGQPKHLTVQGLSANRRTPHTSLAGNRPTAKTPPARQCSLVEGDVMPEQPEDYMRYLSNLSTVSITRNGREFRDVPAYLRQFELSRRGTMESTLTRPAVVRRRSASVTEHKNEQPSRTTPERKQSRIKRAIVAVLSRHRMVGFRNILLVLFLAAYAIGGTFMFYAIEAPYERKHVEQTRVALNEAFEVLARDFEIAATIPHVNMSLLVKKSYLTLIKIDEKYTGSTFYKLEEREYPLWTWTQGTAFVFAFTLYSTVGYGSIAPSTDLARFLTIIYTAVGFPMALVIIRTIGSVILVYVTRIYARLVLLYRSSRRYAASTSPNERIMLPMKAAMALSFVYALLTAIFVMYYDDWMGPDPGFNLFHSFYFTFLSFAAVGLGDVMPANQTNSALVSTVLLLGMPYMRVINRVLYVGIENRMNNTLAFVERLIDSITEEKVVEDERIITVAGDVEFGPRSIDGLSTLNDDSEEEEENRIHNEMLCNFTIRSRITPEVKVNDESKN